MSNFLDLRQLLMILFHLTLAVSMIPLPPNKEIVSTACATILEPSFAVSVLAKF